MATLNGREQASINDNRGVEFDQYPSELLNSVVVYKTPDAALMTQAIGGTVDMQTISPLKHGEQTIAINVRGEWNDLGALNSGSTDKGYRASFSYVDQFADDTIGFAFGYSRMQSPNQEERWQAWGYPNLDYNDANPLVLGGAKPFVRSSELERDGVMAVLEFQPNDQFRSVVDIFYTSFYDEQTLRGIEIPGMWGAGWGNSGITGNKDENGLVTDGTINDAMVVVRNDANTRDADSISVGWNNEYIINTNWSVEADIALSKVDRTDIGIETYSGTGRGNSNGQVEDLGFIYNGDGGYTFAPSLNYADPNLIKLGGAFSWGPSIDGNMQDGFINKPEIEDELSSLRLSSKYTFDEGAISAIEFGVNLTDREKTKDDNGYYLTLKGYEIGSGSNYMMTVPDQYLLSPTSLDFFGMGDVLSYDALRFYNDGNYNELDASTVQMDRAINSWQVEEQVQTYYVKADLDTEVWNVPLTGNFGVQAVNTKQSSAGSAATVNDQGQIELVDRVVSDSYLEWLPSFNLGFAVAEDQMIRLAAARTLSRARMDKMNANLSYSYDDAPTGGNPNWTGGGGNAELRPWMARQYDISYEYYFSDMGYLSVAAYYKDLENYVFDEQVETDFCTILPNDPNCGVGLVTSPQNGNGGYVQGIEASLSIDFGLFADSLSGFGTILNGAYNDSEIKETSDSEPTTLPGLSEKTFNATVYYENAGFQARISSRYRSEFLGEVTKISLQRELVNVKAETLVDAQIGYDFSESGVDALYGLSLVFQVNNLTNEPFTTYFGDDQRLVRDFQNYGRNYMLGANYKF
jgi:iron complex outermembrane receptor protein